MFNPLFHVFLIFSLVSCNSSGSGSFSDLKEFGFKDKVRRVTARIYDDPREENGRWVYRDAEDYVSEGILIFDSEGRLDTVKQRTLVDVGAQIWDETVRVYHREEGRKSGYTQYDGSREKTGEATITWLDAHHYRVEYEELGNRIESDSWLNDDFRDWKGDFRAYRGDKLKFQMKYENSLDSDQHIIESRIEYPLADQEEITRPEGQEYDAKGNLVRFMVDRTPGKTGGRQLTVRTFQYQE